MSPSRTASESQTIRNRVRSLLRGVGAAARPSALREPSAGFERLEDRVLLAGDEPNFNQVFNTGSPLTPVAITLNAQGVGVSIGGNGSSTIAIAGDDDVFSFIAPANDFVRIWGDAVNTGSTLNSRVEIYTGTLGGVPSIVASGVSQGPVSTGTLIDGWAGFIATAGVQYFVVVRSDVGAGTGSIGDYLLRVNAKSTAFPTLDASGGTGSAAGSISIRGGDVVYKVVTGTQAGFESVATVLVQSANSNDLDPRVDVYDSSGQRIAFDSDGGNLTDSFLALDSATSRTFYLRVRSDEFGDPNIRPSTGPFTVLFDGIARNTALDPVTRRGGTGTRAVASQKDIDFFRFRAQGTGLSFITVNTGIPGGMPDSAVHIYDDNGVQIGFNELTGRISRLQIQLIGGRNYFVVVENFDGTAGGVYRGELEIHHTFVASEPLDDHVSLPPGFDPNQPPAFGTPEYDAVRRQFELATPVVWNPTQDAETPPFPGPLPTVATPDHSPWQKAFITGRIHDAGETDLFQFVPPIDLLGNFAGVQDPDTPGMPPVPTVWLPYYRPATSVEILVTAETLFNATVRIFDSNFQLIYGPNTNVLTLGADPAGALDPASWPPTLDPNIYGYTYAGGQPVHIDMWGGEVYYLEISGGGSGRYNGSIQVDAPSDHGAVGPPALPPTSVFGPDIAKAGNWAGAREIQINTNDGEGRNYSNVAAGNVVVANPFIPTFTATPGLPSSGVNLGRAFAMNLTKPTPPAAGVGAAIDPAFIGNPGSRGRNIFRMSDLGLINSPTDTQLYQFRALYTGMAEVRLATTQIADEFFEGMVQTEDGNPLTPPVIEGISRKTKTYNSPLDGALRIFDNDQTELVYNNDNTVTTGENDFRNVGTNARTFERRDPRAVFPVEAGRIYFIQVESGQLQNFNLTFPKVDWRRATGSFELLINSMPNLNFADDHINGNAPGAAAQATPIPIDLTVTSTTATLGSVDGEILNNLTNPTDSDLFNFLAPATGNATIRVAATLGESWDRRLSVFNAAGGLVGQVVAVGTADATINILTNQGDRFYVQVEGDPANPGQQGHYRVSISGIPTNDDYASDPDFFNAYVINKDLYDYDRTETVAGRIGSHGDSDVFSFQTIAFDVGTIRVHSTSLGFHPFIRVFEISEDGAANPILLQIGFNSSGNGTDAVINFSLTAPPRTSGGNGDTFNTYFAVVSGADPNNGVGDYEFTLSLNVATDDHPDAGQYDLATPITLTPIGSTFQAGGADSGLIELTGDTDLFTFTSDSQGLATVTITSPGNSLLLPRVRIWDGNQVAVQSVGSPYFITGPDQPVSVAVFQFTALRNGVYYIQVEGVTTFGNIFKTADTGAYTVDVIAPLPDDHPNIGEFPIADIITLSPFSGDGSSTGRLEITTDTDLFRFTTVANGNVAVTILSPLNEFRPFLRLFDGATAEIGVAVRDGGPGDEDGQLNGAVTRTISSAVAGQTYYLLTSSDQTEPPTHITGGYTAIINGAAPPSGTDDHANAGDWLNATLVTLEPTTGDANPTGNIEIAIDTDLFTFNSIAGSPTRPHRAFVHVVTPNGSALDVGVKIFTIVGGVHFQIAQDTLGGPGVNAQTSFDIDQPNKQYWIEVDGVGGVGSYTVRLDTQPGTFYLYYPEGFANAAIREYVAIGNSNDFDVTYTVRLRYETGNLPDVVITRVIPAHSRGGEIISDGTNTNPLLNQGLVFNSPYAIIVESDGFLGANLSHYDFGNTLGESFTGRTSTTWTFAEGRKFHGQVADFLIYYNPNPTPVVVTLTAYQTDPLTHNVTSVAMSQVVQGFTRRGWNFDDTALLPLGSFAFTVTSAPQTPGAPHIGIVAALSHYDLANSVGFALLGDPTGGATTGVIPGLISTSTALPFVTLFNPTNTVATVNLVGKYINSGLPDLNRSIVLQPFESMTFDKVALGLVPNQTLGIRYTSTVGVTVLADTRQAGDADGTLATTEVGNSFFFGDAFINRLRAGTLYFETLYFYNPDTAALPITLNFQFSDGAQSSFSFALAPQDFAAIRLDQLSAILNHAVFNFFSIQAEASRPFAVTMTHYDLVLAGGWGAQGAPLGPTVPLSSIT